MDPLKIKSNRDPMKPSRSYQFAMTKEEERLYNEKINKKMSAQKQSFEKEAEIAKESKPVEENLETDLAL
jgi:hypothetical protein